VVDEVRLGREPLYVSMFGSGFRSVTGQFPEPAVCVPRTRKGNCSDCTGADPGVSEWRVVGASGCTQPSCTQAI
jgi:hypothetical protein